MEICELDEEMDWGGEEDIYEEMRKTPTETQRISNYNRILETIIEITSQGFRLTEDWMEEHKKLIMVYRDWIPDYNLIDPEIENEDFRKKAYETEVLMRNLVEAIVKTKTFNVKFYLMLLQHMGWLTDNEKELLNSVNPKNDSVDQKLSEMVRRMGL